MKLVWSATTLVLGTWLCVGCGSDADKKVDVQLQRIGSPTWEPVDFHQFSATIGTADSGYVEFYQLSDSLLPPPNHIPHPTLGTGPGAAHAGPYDDELHDGVQAFGLEDTSNFTTAEYTNGRGEVLTWMLVPLDGSPTGSSPDFGSGKILSNAIFPLLLSSDYLHDGTSCGPYSLEVPALDGNLDPPFSVAGHSHIPLFYAATGDPPLAPGCTNPAGSYEWQIRITDVTGNGWDVAVRYQVSP